MNVTPTTSELRRRPPSWRLAWMLPAALSLLAGLNAALLLLGLPAPISTARLTETHGMLLVLGFVGTLVALERATALGRWYGFIAPALLGFGGVALLADPLSLTVGKVMLVAGTAAFTLLYIPLWRRQYDAPLFTQLLAAALACTGASLWLAGMAFDRVVPWLIAFVVLTIAAERVELARITMGPRAGVRLLLLAGAIVLSLLLGLALPDAGAITLGIALVILVVWLGMHDVARRTIRSTGVTRFMAAAILAGYGWLTVGAVTLLFGHPEGYAYDAVLHAVFLGYTMSMIMAHATTILPAVLGITLPYRPFFWAPLVLLQISLVARLLGGLLAAEVPWQTGGALGILALVLFFATAILSAILGPVRGGSGRAAAGTAGK